MLQTTGYKTQNTQVKNQRVLSSASIGSGIKNLSTVVKLAKSKKLDFAKAKPLWTDFLTSGAKKTFIHLKKAFTKALNPRYFDLECYIYNKIDALGYAISKVLSQITLDHRSSNYITHEDSNFSKCEIS